MTTDAPLPLLVTDTFWSVVGERVSAHGDRIEPIVVAEGQMLDDDTVSRLRLACLSGDAYPGRVLDIVRPVMTASKLEWLHTFSAGVDSPFFGGLLDRGVRLTNSSGASAPSIARTVMMVILALSRDLPSWTRAQQARSWEPRRFDEIIGDRLVVVGWGPIGQEVGRLAEAFGLDVRIVRRSATGDEPYPVTPLARLDDAVRDADWVVVALPLTPETRGLFDADTIAAMPPGARFVNVGRGELVDEPAMAAALRSGALAGAGLDVFATEPLPPDSELWSLPNVVVTPHCSGVTDHTDRRATEVFVDNLDAYLRGRAMRNEIRRA